MHPLIPGFTPERPTPRHLLSGLALARPTEPPRAQTLGDLPVPLQCETEGGLHQSVPLQEGRESRLTSSASTKAF